VHLGIAPADVFLSEVGGGDSGTAASRLRVKLRWNLGSVEQVRRRKDESQRTYEAPELRHLTCSNSKPPELKATDCGDIGPAADVWSLGCVLLEFLVWTVCGEQGRRDFFEDRQDEHLYLYESDESGDVSDRTTWGQFHVEGERSESVDGVLDKVLARRRVFDDVTEEVGKFILENMLASDPGCRKTASELANLFDEMWLGISGRSAKAYEEGLVMWEASKAQSCDSSSSYVSSSEDVVDSSDGDL
jgi:serine/threonine protein kinase